MNLLASQRRAGELTGVRSCSRTSLRTEELIPADHPIRRIRVVVDAVLAELDPVFDGM